MHKLPDSFIQRMKSNLGPQANAFLSSFEESRTFGLRLNRLKVGPVYSNEWLREELGPLTPVPWCPDGYYYEEDVRPGLHPYHDAGVYYIQEPSAMSVVEWLDPQPGEAVLDLAAAPGGKSTQIADKLQGEGLLIANEIHPARAKILSQNIERMGIRNTIVTNASPDQLAARFTACFDRILVDAPCSGEGMFRKDPLAIAEWSPEQVTACAARQRDILEYAVHMLKPGGIFAYSTCTFSEEENENIVEWLLSKFPEMVSIQTERIWPHLHRGEGHFVALLQKSSSSEHAKSNKYLLPSRTANSNRSEATLSHAMNIFREFSEQNLPGFSLASGEAILFGEQLYWLPRHEDILMHSAQLHGLKLARPGLHLGTVRKNRFEPAHALALAANGKNVHNIVAFHPHDPAVAAYLRGEEIPVPSHVAGWVLFTVGKFPLGWGKASSGRLKNHYPKGLRR